MDKALAHDDAVLQAREILKGRYLCLDTETTGLLIPEVCQLAFVQEDVEAFDWLIKPINPISPEATAIHGITNEMVENASGIDHYWSIVHEHMHNRKIVGYNLQFDLAAIKRTFELREIDFQWDQRDKFDVMYCYAAFHGEVNPATGTFKWQKLEEAMKQCNIEWGWGVAHNALSDARATLALLWHISEQKTTWEVALDVALKQLDMCEHDVMVGVEGDDGYIQGNLSDIRELNKALEAITYRKV